MGMQLGSGDGTRREFVETVAANIRAEAGRRGLHQRDVARYLGLAPSRVSERWRGITPWQLDDIEKMAALFGCPPQTLCESVPHCAVAV